MIITDFLERNARLYGSEISLVEINPSEERDRAVTWREFNLIESNSHNVPYRREMTWRDFDRRANRFANLLLSRGVKKGTKVGILLMNCLEWLPIYFGVLKSGCIAVPMNFRYASDEIKYCVELADVEILIFGEEFISRINVIADSLSSVKMFYVGEGGPDYTENCLALLNFCSSSAPPVALSEDDDAAIYFSSGTTGFPKAILHKHRSLVHACKVEQNHHSQGRDDVFLCIPPLYHTGAKMHWFGSLISGSRAVLLRGVKPEWILRTASEEKCSIVWLLVPWAQDILNALDSGELKLSDYDLSRWRLMHIGAQPVPQSLIKHWLEYFPNHQYDTNYGLSESIGPGAVHLGVENVHKVGAIGIPGYGWEVKIVDENGKDVEGQNVGELILRGDGVMECYYKNPEATAEVLKDGWLYTGDMAMRDEDGFIFLVDRKKDVIITGGENLYPVQIEDFIRTNNKVSDVAVIGLPDERLGEIAAAIIKIKDGMEATEEEINDFCLAMPRYKRPRKIIFADVPRNPTGKIEKPLLRKIYGAEHLIADQNER
ncbi:MAG: class I adenylate-forming enzyme family protein [Candidatus Fimenecus sp.]